MKYPRMLRIPLDDERRENKRYATMVDLKELLDGMVFIGEKFDGSIVSFTNEDDDIVTGGRRREIMRNGILKERVKAYIKLDAWYWNNYSALMDIPEGYTLIGEWLFAKHTIFYKSLPDWWICFDVYDGTTFLEEYEKRKIIDNLGFEEVPTLAYGRLNMEDLERLATLKWSYYGDRTEGFVVKNYSKQLFMKYVKHEFDTDLELSEHWLKQPLEVNKLRKEKSLFPHPVYEKC